MYECKSQGRLCEQRLGNYRHTHAADMGSSVLICKTTPKFYELMKPLYVCDMNRLSGSRAGVLQRGKGDGVWSVMDPGL